MFIDPCRPASESLVDDENFLALEIKVLDDLTAIDNPSSQFSVTATHLRYLEAVHARGEHAYGLNLVNRLLTASLAPTAVSLADLLSCKADMLAALGREDDAESALIEAGGAPAGPQIRERIALKLAALLASQGKDQEAAAVLAAAHDLLNVTEKSAEIVATLAVALVRAGENERAERLLRDHVSPQNGSDAIPFPAAESVVCELVLASILLDQGRCMEADDLLIPLADPQAAISGLLQAFARYYLAVGLAARSGILLPEALASRSLPLKTGTSVDAEPRLFGSFSWITEGHEAGGVRGGFKPPNPLLEYSYLATLLHAAEIERQGRAYALLATDDVEGAIDEFRRLAAMRNDLGRNGGLVGAVDSNGLAVALKQAGRSEALPQARETRRNLQMLFGLSSAGTQQAVLDEAQLLMDQGDTREASALVEPCLLHRATTERGREVLLQLRLLRMEVATRSGRAVEALASARSLEVEASSLDIGVRMIPVLRYQKAAAAAASGDFGVAEHEFDSLRRDLEETYGPEHDLSAKASYGLARVLQRQGKYELAVSVLLTFLETDLVNDRRLSVRARRRIAECLIQVDDPAGAANHMRDCADALSRWTGDRDPAYLDARLGQADCLLACGRYGEARVVFRGIWEVLHSDYTGLEFFYLRAVMGNGTCLRRLNEYSGAAFNYQRAHALNALVNCLDGAEALQLEKWLAWSLEMAGELKAAAQHYKRSIELVRSTTPHSTELPELQSRLACCLR